MDGARSKQGEGDGPQDMLVPLYDLPDASARIEALRAGGIEVRRALAPERHVVVGWVREQFGEAWASECEVSFGRLPISCFRAQRGQEILGFACYDATAKGFFGPTGVLESERAGGIGTALLLLALQAMAAEGYAYAIIGGVGPAGFYQKTVGAVPIAGSTPGIYTHLLRGRRGGHKT
ncbi:MAG TPA: GNAT family N-acetyltransferase [Candidatus Limnocylindria bacterium]|nr:GNAT family N-acetyltransferase [Candidatus Limnocylindria bacterium]